VNPFYGWWGGGSEVRRAEAISMVQMPASQGVPEVGRAEAIADGSDACFAGSLRSEKSRDHNRWLRCLPRRVFQKREGQRDRGESGR